MGKGKRNRRPGGHPAKVAKRRERDAARRSRAFVTTEQLAPQLVQSALELTNALDAELWASHLLGAVWSRRNEALLDAVTADYRLRFGGPLVEAIQRTGGAGARIALEAIAAVDGGELGGFARELADEMSSDPEAVPDWVERVGKATITGAAVTALKTFIAGWNARSTLA